MADTDSGSPLHLAMGNMCCWDYRKKCICLVTYTNAITCKNFGHAKVLAEAYPYGNVAGVRYSNDRGIAQTSDRGVEGTIIVEKPGPHLNDHPTIATLITQYGIGKPIELNKISETIVRYTKDMDHAKRLQCDTSFNRVKKFDDCLLHLRSELSKEENSALKIVLIPVGIGRGGQMDDEWIDYYLPMLYDFSRSVKSLGKKVFLIMSNYYRDKLEEGARALSAINKIPLLKKSDMPEIYGEDVCGKKPFC